MLKVLAVISSILYPIIIFLSLTYFNATPRVLALVLLSVAMVYFIANTNNAKGKGFKRIQFWGTIAVATTLSILTFITENSGFIKFYPVFISLLLLMSFAVTLRTPPSMIFRFAQLADKSITQSKDRDYIEKYCKTVTKIWVCFFCINGFIAIITAIFADYKTWTLYNGLISYILIGFIFTIEFIVRKIKVKK